MINMHEKYTHSNKYTKAGSNTNKTFKHKQIHTHIMNMQTQHINPHMYIHTNRSEHRKHTQTPHKHANTIYTQV